MTDSADDTKSPFEVVRLRSIASLEYPEPPHQGMANSIELTAVNLDDHVQRARNAFPGAAAEPFCLVTGGDAKTEAFRSGEHFIPHSLGYSWTKFRPGVGTCDRVNSGFSGHEAEWLRQGMMGVYRPFFVPSGKDGAPEYYSPRKTDAVLSIKQKKGSDTKQIRVHKGQMPLLDPVLGPGRGKITTPVSMPVPSSVSLALHKMAYLCLWLLHPELLQFQGPRDVARYLAKGADGDRSKDSFRPYEERMMGSRVGVTVSFWLRGSPGVLDRNGVPQSARLTGIVAILDIHHMKYAVCLSGNPWELLPVAGRHVHSWRDPDLRDERVLDLPYEFQSAIPFRRKKDAEGED
jgi:hypothetical protein